MSIYYLEFQKGLDVYIFSLDCTREVSLSDDGNVTSYPIESGSAVSDHYVNDNIYVTMSGVISDVKSGITRSTLLGLRSTEEFIADLRKLKKEAIPFKIHLGANLGIIDNCVFQSLTIKQNKQHGTLVRNGRVISSFEISFTAKQIRNGFKAREIVVTDEVIEKTVAPERPKAGQKVEASEEKKTSIWKQAYALSIGEVPEI